MEPLKNRYTPDLINAVAQTIKQQYPPFQANAFCKAVQSPPWESLELKARMHHLSGCLDDFLTDDFCMNSKILAKSARQFSGFEFMFFPDYIEQYGLAHFACSIQALSVMTEYASAEFAVRPFIHQNPKRMMQQCHLWAKSNNPHLRRLASEGCRPRLPWAKALPQFKQDPSRILPILETLKADDSLYVRKSVANNLNDISKDHPNLILEIASSWLGNHPHTDWIIKHACRSLLKQAHPKALALFGYPPANHIQLEQFSCDPIVTLGQTLTFQFSLRTKDAKLGKLRLEYAIDFIKSRGQHHTKIFKIGEADYDAKRKHWRKSVTFKPLTTRKLYAGEHFLSLIVNGETLHKVSFDLIFPTS